MCPHGRQKKGRPRSGYWGRKAGSRCTEQALGTQPFKLGNQVSDSCPEVQCRVFELRMISAPRSSAGATQLPSHASDRTHRGGAVAVREPTITTLVCFVGHTTAARGPARPCPTSPLLWRRGRASFSVRLSKTTAPV